MPMEIRPIQGQPGLFRQGLAAYTSPPRWGGTTVGARPPYAGPFGAIPLPAEFVSAPMPEHLSQEDVPAGKVPGLAFKLVLFTPGPLVPQASLDAALRGMLGQLGYDVSSSTLGAQPLTFKWVYEASDKSWEAVIASGPKEVVGLKGWKVVYDAPTAEDLKGLPVTAETWSVVARPKDGTITPVKMNALITASRTTRAALSKQFDIPTELYVHVQGVPPGASLVEPKPLMAGIGGVLGLIGVGWLSYLALRGKSVVETR